MKRVLLSTAILLTAIMAPPPSALAQSETAVTGAGEAVFPAGTDFYGVPLRGFQFVKGVSISGDGSAVGEFQIFLLVADDRAAPIVVAGKPTRGHVNADGSATFEGVARVEFADGEVRTDAPFMATVTADGLELSIDGAHLPAATVTVGSITVRPMQ